jgi:hypothetical protein
VDAALDIAGSGVIPELIELVGDASRVLSVADFTAPQYGAQLSLVAQEHPERVLAEAARLYSEGVFRVRQEKTFPLAQAAEAYKICAAGHVTGREDTHCFSALHRDNTISWHIPAHPATLNCRKLNSLIPRNLFFCAQF